MYDKIISELESSKRFYDQCEYLKEKARPQISVMARALVKVQDKLISATVDSVSVNLSYVGNKHTLNAIFQAFRKEGYKPEVRPGTKPEALYTSYLRHPDKEAPFYLRFTSTKCTRVKVGTKTVEQDVYEVICD